jgi:hypothetical protein
MIPPMMHIAGLANLTRLRTRKNDGCCLLPLTRFGRYTMFLRFTTMAVGSVRCYHGEVDIMRVA